MSIKKLVTITATCDGPCGTALQVDDVVMPQGWVLIKVDKPYPVMGENPTLLTSGLCPKCAERFHQIMNHAGYSFSSKEKRKEGGSG